MRLVTCEALILDVFDLHDRDRIVTFLTRERGKKKGVAKGARAKHSRFAGQLQPLAKAQVTWFEKDGQDLVRLSAVDLERPAHQLSGDLDGLLVGSYLVDHMLEFAQEDEASEYLYRLLDSTTEALIAGVDRDLAARYFEVWVLRLTGIFPAPDACPLCGGPFSAGAVLPAGGDALLCAGCAGDGAGLPGEGGGLRVGPEVLDLLRRIGRENLKTLGETPPRAAPLRQVEELCARVRRRFLQRELKSYEVIRRTRAGL